MSKKNKNWLSKGLILPVFATVIAGILVEVFTSDIFFGPVLDFARFIESLFDTKLLIPLWLLTLIIIGVIYSTTKLIAYLNKDTVPDYKSYTNDRIFGVDWQWKWIGDRIDSLVALCPECAYQPKVEETYNFDLENESSGLQSSSKMVCDNCGFEQVWQDSPEYLKNRATREIHRKIRTGEYKSTI